jgi:hypothetical protein
MTRTSGGGGAVDFFWQPLANKSAAKIKKTLQLFKKVVIGRNPAFIIYSWNVVLKRSAAARTLYPWPPSCQQALGRAVRKNRTTFNDLECGSLRPNRKGRSAAKGWSPRVR